jgi:hypothetical protein
MAIWADIGAWDPNWKVGDIGFIAYHEDINNPGRGYYKLYEGPVRTNMSRQYILSGWAGTFNNRVTNAEGIGRVARVTSGGDRMQIARVKGAAAIAEALEELGWPELEDA